MIIWLFLMQLYLPLGIELVGDVNVEEVVVDTGLGDVGRYLIGILEAMIMLQVGGKRTIKLLFLQAVVILCQTAKFFAFLAIKTPIHTVETNLNMEQVLSCSTNKTN